MSLGLQKPYWCWETLEDGFAVVPWSLELQGLVSLETGTIKLGLEHRALGADLVLDASLDQMRASFSFPMGRMFLSMLSCLGLGDAVTWVM